VLIWTDGAIHALQLGGCRESASTYGFFGQPDAKDGPF
jgi:hypothetical protein